MAALSGPPGARQDWPPCSCPSGDVFDKEEKDGGNTNSLGSVAGGVKMCAHISVLISTAGFPGNLSRGGVRVSSGWQETRMVLCQQSR